MAVDGLIDEHFLMRYRLMLDAEAAAFDELEHAFEDGDREHFEADLSAWETAVASRLAYLRRFGMNLEATPTG